jgi:DNA-binding transcriptional LysR family regulator
MTFEQVLVFHKIVQLGSFKAAANELHKTQPAISLSIKKLEDEMEVELFDRSSYRPELTHHGKTFLERSQRVYQGMQELEDLSLSFRKNEEPEITISIDGISPLPQLLGLFKKFNEKFPNTKLNFGFEILSQAERNVLARESHFGVTHFISEPDALEILPITSVKMLPVVCKELYDEKKLKSESDLLDIEQIVIADKAGPKGQSFGLLDGGKKWRLSDANFKHDIILAGLGWGHLPEHTIAREVKEGKLIVLNFESIKPRELSINLIRLKKQHMGIVSKKLWEEMTKIGKLK